MPLWHALVGRGLLGQHLAVAEANVPDEDRLPEEREEDHPDVPATKYGLSSALMARATKYGLSSALMALLVTASDCG